MRRAAELQLAFAVVAALFAAGAQPARGVPREDWRARVAAAERYAEGRLGSVSFALVDARGRVHGHRADAPVPTASLLKAMLLVGYLRLPSVRERDLTSREKGLLGPMIRRSANAPVAVILPLVGAERLYRLARIAGMTRFRLAWPVWGLSQTTARDQACFFHGLDARVPARHRGYALRLLGTVVPSQSWGVGRVAHPGWRLYFKGGWGSGTGLVDHQSALLTSRGARVALGLTTRFNPDHDYGKATLRGLARRLLGGLRPPGSAGSWLPP